MAAYKTVAVVGASSSFGSAVLEALLAADFTVTVLTRPGSSTTFPSGVNVVKVDYSDVDALTKTLRGIDAVVSTVGFPGMLGQTTLIDAAIAAGVKRVLPSEYGSDPDDARARLLPVFAYKVEIEKYCKAKVQGTGTSYTLVANNGFFDWDLDNDFGADIKKKEIEIFDGGDYAYSAAPLSFIARGIAAVLQRAEQTANRVVRLHGMSMTRNKQLELMQRYTGKEGWRVSHVSSADREKEAYTLLQTDPQNVQAWAINFLHCVVFGTDFHNHFSGDNDNELLGLREVSEAEIEAIVKSRA